MTTRLESNNADLDNFWMPFTANRRFKKSPRMLTGAKGMYYTDAQDGKVLDGTSGLWCVNAGHGRREIADSVARQLIELDFAPTFQLGHPIAFRFAERLATIAPAGLDRIFFTNSGSEAVDTALKIALGYQRSIGQPGRTRLIGRERAYHGVNFGGMSVGGIVGNRIAFGSILPGVDHLRHTHDLAANAFTRGLPVHGAELADDLERLVQLHGAETIAAVIVEPVAGSTGVLLPPQGYLQRLRDIATRHGIVLIFDEVITGFGRLGAPFASNVFGVVPDLMTTAKGITNAAVPMGAVFAHRAIHDALMHGDENGIELAHGYTHSGHPVACAAGLAAMDIYENEGLFTRAAELAEYWQDAIFSLQGMPGIVDLRVFGLVAAIELMPRHGKPGARGYDIFLDCLRRGLLIRVTGDIIAISPPLIVEKTQIDEMVSRIRDAVSRIA